MDGRMEAGVEQGVVLIPVAEGLPSSSCDVPIHVRGRDSRSHPEGVTESNHSAFGLASTPIAVLPPVCPLRSDSEGMSGAYSASDLLDVRGYPTRHVIQNPVRGSLVPWLSIGEAGRCGTVMVESSV